jgi:SEL1 protein
VHFADPSIETSVPTHPALAEPQKWAAAAVFAAAEMGSRDARLAAGDRVLRGRGAAFSFFEDEDADHQDDFDAVDFDVPDVPDIDFACERATRVYLLPAAERAADAAEAAGDVRVPPEPPRLRARERDAGYVDDADAEEDGDAQIEMERDMAARGVPEAERHLGYRALMGRGVARDEGDALARFRAAADLGDPLAMFNLGYMHMHGVGTGVNHTEARALFEKAASLDVAAAHNGVGVLDYNGWATGDGAPDLAAARARFEAGAAAGDPDASFNLGTLYQAGAGGLPLDHAEAYARYQAASDAGHWRAPLAVAKLTLEGWDPSAAADGGGGGGGGDGDGESTRPARVLRRETSETSDPDEASFSKNEERGRVVKNCREAARLLAVFLEERLAVFSDEHEDALAALEGGFVEAEAAESRAGAASDSENAKNAKNEETSEVEVGPDPWGALVRYALIAERGSEAGLANAAFLAKKRGAGAAKTRWNWNVRGGWEKWEKESEAFPPHLTRRAARDAARLALTRLAAAGDVEARVDLGDVEWAAAVEGDDDTNDTNDALNALNPNRQNKRKASHPRPPSAPAPDASSPPPPPPPPPAPPREEVFLPEARDVAQARRKRRKRLFWHTSRVSFPLFSRNRPSRNTNRVSTATLSRRRRRRPRANSRVRAGWRFTTRRRPCSGCPRGRLVWRGAGAAAWACLGGT